uniref:Uncharacterized protein n=1 Tax=Noccaea caerulescens TaxID=107243 RepID=A0A1J3JBL9_NOCCA
MESVTAEIRFELKMSGAGDAGGGPSNRNNAVAPKNKDKTIGMGSIRQVPVASSLAPRRQRSEDDLTQLRAKITSLEQTMQEERAHNDAIFEIMAMKNPQIATLLREKRRKREAAARDVAEEKELTEEQWKTANMATSAAREAERLQRFY